MQVNVQCVYIPLQINSLCIHATMDNCVVSGHPECVLRLPLHFSLLQDNGDKKDSKLINYEKKNMVRIEK